MIKKRYLVALGAFSAAIAGCGGSDADNGNPSRGSGATGSGATGGSSTGGTGTGGSAGMPNGGTTCMPGVPASSQIQRMKNVEYDNVVRDLLGVTGIASSGNAKPSELLVADSDGSLTDIAWNAYLSVADKIATEVMAELSLALRMTSAAVTASTWDR